MEDNAVSVSERELRAAVRRFLLGRMAGMISGVQQADLLSAYLGKEVLPLTVDLHRAYEEVKNENG